MRRNDYKRKTLLLCTSLLLTCIPALAQNTNSDLDAATNVSGTAASGTESGGNVKVGESSLQGHVVANADAPDKIISDLLQTAMSRDSALQQLDNHHKHYSNLSSRAAAKTKDMMNFLTSYTGFERSSEAADVILNEKLKPKSQAAVIYIKQRQQDLYATKMFTALTEMAAGLGNPDEHRRDEIVNAAVQHLAPYVGDEEAKRALQRMRSWSDSLASETDAQKALDVLETEKQISSAINGALKKDDVVAEIQDRLHKYNGRSNLMRVTAKVVNTTLSIAMLCPNIISPAAQVAYAAFCASTGGPEDAKLLNELYLDQRFQSRWKLYNHTATTAANNYSVGVLSKNTVLTQFCKKTLDTMSAAPPESAVSSDDSAPEPTKAEESAASGKTQKTSKARGVKEAHKSSAHKVAHAKSGKQKREQKKSIADSHLTGPDDFYQ